MATKAAMISVDTTEAAEEVTTTTLTPVAAAVPPSRTRRPKRSGCIGDDAENVPSLRLSRWLRLPAHRFSNDAALPQRRCSAGAAVSCSPQRATTTTSSSSLVPRALGVEVVLLELKVSLQTKRESFVKFSFCFANFQPLCNEKLGGKIGNQRAKLIQVVTK
jgi:hypothetical protein